MRSTCTSANAAAVELICAPGCCSAVAEAPITSASMVSLPASAINDANAPHTRKRAACSSALPAPLLGGNEPNSVVSRLAAVACSAGSQPTWASVTSAAKRTAARLASSRCQPCGAPCCSSLSA
eukprot:3503852-Prymnesium_polylepis.1